jgi:hypothetical protein
MKNIKKIPIQIYLEREQDRTITLLAKASRKSKASVIRTCIEKYVASLPPDKDPALKVMNLGASGKRDIAEKHDDYLAQPRKAKASK